MRCEKDKIYITKDMDEDTKTALKEFANLNNDLCIGQRIGKWLEEEREEEFKIDTNLQQMEYEAVIQLMYDNPNLAFSKVIEKWHDYVAWDFAAFYIGDDL